MGVNARRSLRPLAELAEPPDSLATPDPLKSSHLSISSTSPRSMFHNCAVSR